MAAALATGAMDLPLALCVFVLRECAYFRPTNTARKYDHDGAVDPMRHMDVGRFCDLRYIEA